MVKGKITSIEGVAFVGMLEILKIKGIITNDEMEKIINIPKAIVNGQEMVDNINNVLVR